MPSLKLLNKDTLLEFLGPDLNSQLTSTTRPTTNAPRACNLLATAVGSGGEFIGMIKVRICKNVYADTLLTVNKNLTKLLRCVKADSGCVQVLFRLLPTESLFCKHEVHW